MESSGDTYKQDISDSTLYIGGSVDKGNKMCSAVSANTGKLDILDPYCVMIVVVDLIQGCNESQIPHCVVV